MGFFGSSPLKQIQWYINEELGGVGSHSYTGKGKQKKDDGFYVVDSAGNARPLDSGMVDVPSSSDIPPGSDEMKVDSGKKYLVKIRRPLFAKQRKFGSFRKKRYAKRKKRYQKKKKRRFGRLRK